MAHGHCSHAHDHSHAVPESRLGMAVALTLAFVVAEAIAGYWADSLALLSDAGHNFADAGALVLSWYALRVASRPSTRGMTFGFHRVGILAALINSATLVVMAVLILWEAIGRLRAPGPVDGGLMIGVAGVALVMNLVISLWLREGAHDLNIRSAYLHMLGDAVSAAGVVVAGSVVAMTGSMLADPLVSLLIAGLIFYSSVGILKDSVNVLLEGTPPGLDMGAVEESIRGVPGVLAAHDLHVWMIGTGVIACSCHVVVAEQSIRSGQLVRRAVAEALHAHFRINHTTIEVEVESCGAADAMYCNVDPKGTSPGHSHG
jgi:cobalt-zinc-cadmium efflux system protein